MAFIAKRNLTVRLDEDLREWLEEEAKQQMRPLANQIVYILREYRRSRRDQENLESSESPATISPPSSRIG